uniref:RxLR effector protein n=1 Tax=Phytophthora agathidicida TaxID=1642459 RepID=A0A7G4WI10_9STRA|nr:PaRXLR21 [Phytophthora agathidicida]
MRVCYILLMAAATLLASNEAATIFDHKQAISAQKVETKKTMRFLRSPNTMAEKSDGGEEERVGVSKLGDLLAAGKLGAKFDKKELAAQAKTVFESMAENPSVKTQVLKKVAETGDTQLFNSLRTDYLWGKVRKFDREEIADAVRKRRNMNQ